MAHELQWRNFEFVKGYADVAAHPTPLEFQDAYYHELVANQRFDISENLFIDLPFLVQDLH